jgi:hypothetical protein
LLYLGIAVVAFILGKRYGATVEKEAVAVAISVFSKAKAALGRVIVSAQLEAKQEVERLESLAAKYL